MSPFDFHIYKHWDKVAERRGLIDGFGDSFVSGISEGS